MTRPFTRFYRSNKATESHQQLPVEERSIKSDSSNIQATISQTQSFNEVMKRMPPIPSSKEEKPQLMLVCNQDEFFVQPKKIKQNLVLEVSTTAKISEKIDKSQEKCKRVGHDKLEVLSPMENNRHHGTFILQDFENPFLHNECIQDYNVHRFLDWNSRTSYLKRGMI